MRSDPRIYAEERARVNLADLVNDLCRFYDIRIRIEKEMEWLADRYRNTIRGSRLLLRIKMKRPGIPPSSIVWMVLSRPKPNAYEILHPEVKRPSRLRPLKGPLTDRIIYVLTRQIKRAPDFHAFGKRAAPLNEAAKELADASRSFKQTLYRLAKPLEHEPKPPPLPLDLFQPAIPSRAREDIENVWRVLYRIGLVEAELVATTERWREDPPYPPFDIAFRRDASCPWGRVYWRDTNLNRSLGSLTDRALRRLGIPESQRKKITPHEIHRRRTNRLNQHYTEPLARIKQRIEKAVALAFRLLEKSQTIALPSTPLDLQWQAADRFHPEEPAVVPNPPAQPEKEAS